MREHADHCTGRDGFLAAQSKHHTSYQSVAYDDDDDGGDCGLREGNNVQKRKSSLHEEDERAHHHQVELRKHFGRIIGTLNAIERRGAQKREEGEREREEKKEKE